MGSLRLVWPSHWSHGGLDITFFGFIPMEKAPSPQSPLYLINLLPNARMSNHLQVVF